MYVNGRTTETTIHVGDLMEKVMRSANSRYHIPRTYRYKIVNEMNLFCLSSGFKKPKNYETYIDGAGNDW